MRVTRFPTIPYCLCSREHGCAFIAVALFAAFLLVSFGIHAQTPAFGQQPRHPVLIELFTSEGCSDCPPADTLLAQLDATQFVPSAEAIILSEHITYFNYLGWQDPFSSETMTERQKAYSRELGLGDVYTPQMVVDGTQQFVGSDSAKLRAALAKAALMPKIDLQIAAARRLPDGALEFSVRAPQSANATLLAAVALSKATSPVKHGENAGRMLNHVAVAQAIKDFGSAATDGRTLHFTASELVNANKSGTQLRLVVFLADRRGHVVGAAEKLLD
jgi:hypothetical protein